MYVSKIIFANKLCNWIRNVSLLSVVCLYQDTYKIKLSDQIFDDDTIRINKI